MNDFTPAVPVELQIRRVIYERFNDIDENFTNDDIFEILKSGGDIDPSWIIDDTESLFNGLCDSGLARNIGQNFTTIYLKLFDLLVQSHCPKCDRDIHLGSEEKKCPDPLCGSLI